MKNAVDSGGSDTMLLTEPTPLDVDPVINHFECCLDENRTVCGLRIDECDVIPGASNLECVQCKRSMELGSCPKFGLCLGTNENLS